MLERRERQKDNSFIKGMHATLSEGLHRNMKYGTAMLTVEMKY